MYKSVCGGGGEGKKARKEREKVYRSGRVMWVGRGCGHVRDAESAGVREGRGEDSAGTPAALTPSGELIFSGELVIVNKRRVHVWGGRKESVRDGWPW